MNNTTQTRYVRILPSAVESKFDQWPTKHIGAIWQVDAEKENAFIIMMCPIRSSHIIEKQHVQEVYVYDEPRDAVQPTAKPMRVRVVKAGNELYWYSNKLGNEYNVFEVSYLKYGVLIDGKHNGCLISKEDCEVVQPEPDRIAELEKRVSQLEESMEYEIRRVDDFICTTQQPAPQQESNLDKAKRIYYKGVRFKSMGLITRGDEYVSSGVFTENLHGDIFMQEMINDKPIMRLVYSCGQWAEVVQPEVKQWRLKVDVPEWGLKKGDTSKTVLSGYVEFSTLNGDSAHLALSIMPYIADPVG